MRRFSRLIPYVCCILLVAIEAAPAPTTGTPGIDPYARAAMARTGAVPIGAGDGVAFFAVADEAGRAFDGRCDTVILGTTPAARFWTLTLYDPQGRLVANSAARNSSSILFWFSHYPPSFLSTVTGACKWPVWEFGGGKTGQN